MILMALAGVGSATSLGRWGRGGERPSSREVIDAHILWTLHVTRRESAQLSGTANTLRQRQPRGGGDVDRSLGVPQEYHREYTAAHLRRGLAVWMLANPGRFLYRRWSINGRTEHDQWYVSTAAAHLLAFNLTGKPQRLDLPLLKNTFPLALSTAWTPHIYYYLDKEKYRL